MAALALALLPLGAGAWCVENRLRDRDVVAEQKEQPHRLREERRFRHVLAPGDCRCCRVKDLDCNPDGRLDSIVDLTIGVRVMPNPRRSGVTPYIVRVRTHDKDITGPRGLPCPPLPTKGTR